MNSDRRTAMIVLATSIVTMAAVVAGLAAMLDPGSASGEARFLRVPIDKVDSGTYCQADRYYCITPESAAEGYALATVNQRSFTVLAKHNGCPAKWLPHFDLESVNGGEGRGAFRVPCDGQTWSALGVRLFGPTATDLTRLPMTIDGGDYVVDVRPLQALLGFDPAAARRGP